VKVSKSKSQSDAGKNVKKGNVKQKKMLEEEERDNAENEDINSNSSLEDEGDDEDVDVNFDLQREVKEVPKFSYGELSKDYPVLLKDIEEMYLEDKKKFEDNFKLEKLKN